MHTLTTDRLTLRQWRATDLEPFAALNADPEVMRYLPRALSRGESDALAASVRDELARRGWGLRALEVRVQARFIGCVGAVGSYLEGAVHSLHRDPLASRPPGLGMRLRDRSRA